MHVTCARDAQRYLSALTPILLQLFELRLVYEPVDSLTVAYPVRQFLIYIYLYLTLRLDISQYFNRPFLFWDIEIHSTVLSS